MDLAPLQVAPDQTVATVNGEPLSLEEFDNEFRLMQIHYSAVSEGDMRAIKRRLFEQVINRRILVQEARKNGLTMTRKEVDETFQDALQDVSDDFLAVLKAQGVSEQAWKRKLLQEKLARKLVDQEVNVKVVLSDQEVEEYYWSHLRDYWKPEAIRARHLGVRGKRDLDRALAELKKGTDFAQAVSMFSVGMEKSQGGDWGAMAVDRILPAHRAIFAKMKPGEVSKPLKDNFGYHLFQLVERLPRRMESFPEVRERIKDGLLKEEQDLRFDQWMADLKKKTAIKVNKDMAPLVGVTLEGSREN